MKKTMVSHVAILFAIPLIATAQLPLSVELCAGGGMLFPQSSSIKGNISSVHEFPLSKTNYSVGGKLRVGLPLIPLSIVGSVSYNALKDEATLPVATTGGPVNTGFTNSLSVLSVGIGAEYTIIPAPIVKPYVSGAATMNFFTGSARYDNNVIPEATMNSASRIGASAGLGARIEIPLLPLSFDAEAKYQFANLGGKTFDSGGYSYSGFGGIPQTATYNLNDAKNPADPNDHDRSVNFLTVMLSISFHIL